MDVTSSALVAVAVVVGEKEEEEEEEEEVEECKGLGFEDPVAV